MTVTVQVLFDQPQHEIASLLRDRLRRCAKASLVAGFMTVEGIEAIAAPLRAAPSKLVHLVVGAATWRAFDALDRLLVDGIAPAALHVHLGHTRATTAGATYRFYRYHPMLHSKVYLMEMADGTSAAFIGSHNMTGFALLGLNGEAGVLLEGPSQDPQFVAIRQHIAEAVAQAIPYDSAMKDAYAWWTTQFVEGLRDKTRDTPDPDGAENKRTVVVIAASASLPLPQKGDIIYFEIQSALGQSIRSLATDVHIYIFPTVPSSPAQALHQLRSASTSLWCKTIGLESDGGGEGLRADWFIDNARHPELKRTPKPFQPKAGHGMEQVRVTVSGPVFGNFDYLFDRGRGEWLPVFDDETRLAAAADAQSMLLSLDLIQPEHLPWQRVRGLVPAEASGSEVYETALREAAPQSGSFILFSLRRRSAGSQRKARVKRGKPQ